MGVSFHQTETTEASFLAIVLITMLITTGIVHFIVNDIVKYSQQNQLQAQELSEKNQSLQRIQASLEARTQELSRLYGDLQSEMVERMRTEAALRQRQKLESIGFLAGGVAHDFNNLLTSIQSQAELALRRIETQKDPRPNIQKAIQSTQRAADLTRQLLAYAGKATLRIEPIDLNQLIRNNNALLETALQKTSTLQLALSSNLWAVEADRGQLQQVLMNLVINASEAIQHDHGYIEIKTECETLDRLLDIASFVGQAPLPGRYVCLSVADNGVGMDTSVQEKIFEPYYSTKDHGRGLGLAAVIGIIHRLGGGLQVESQLGRGTRFRVYLPASPQRSLSAAPHEEAILVQPLATNLILVVDDEEAVREAAADMLTSVGYHTLTASTGEEAVNLYQQRQSEIGLVLLDVMMPGLNGPETLQQMRAINPVVNVVLSSGYSDPAIFSQAMQQKPNDFLPKPYSLEQMTKTIDKSLRSQRLMHKVTFPPLRVMGGGPLDESTSSVSLSPSLSLSSIPLTWEMSLEPS